MAIEEFDIRSCQLNKYFRMYIKLISIITLGLQILFSLSLLVFYFYHTQKNMFLTMLF